MFWKETKRGKLKPQNYKPTTLVSKCSIAHNNNWNESSFPLILCPTATVENKFSSLQPYSFLVCSCVPPLFIFVVSVHYHEKTLQEVASIATICSPWVSWIWIVSVTFSQSDTFLYTPTQIVESIFFPPTPLGKVGCCVGVRSSTAQPITPTSQMLYFLATVVLQIHWQDPAVPTEG